jgi:hypothetical protein
MEIILNDIVVMGVGEGPVVQASLKGKACDGNACTDKSFKADACKGMACKINES